MSSIALGGDAAHSDDHGHELSFVSKYDGRRSDCRKNVFACCEVASWYGD